MSRFWIGTSGYGHRQWYGDFYPEGLDEGERLRFYAGRLNSVELSHTFNRTASLRQLQSLAKEVGDEFTLSLKAPRRVTHDLQLRDAAEIAGDFCETAQGLGGKLGVLRFQIPPFVRRDVPRLEDFLHQLPPDRRVAFEFRNASWFADETLECLQRFGSALCVTDGDELQAPLEATATFGYFRLRRAEYDDADLAEIVERIRARADSWDDVFVYFKHESAAPAHAVALRERLRAPA